MTLPRASESSRHGSAILGQDVPGVSVVFFEQILLAGMRKKQGAVRSTRMVDIFLAQKVKVILGGGLYLSYNSRNDIVWTLFKVRLEL